MQRPDFVTISSVIVPIFSGTVIKNIGSYLRHHEIGFQFFDSIEETDTVVPIAGFIDVVYTSIGTPDITHNFPDSPVVCAVAKSLYINNNLQSITLTPSNIMLATHYKATLNSSRS